MKGEYKVLIGGVIMVLVVFAVVNYLSASKYKEENAAYELWNARLVADSIMSAEIIAASEYRYDSLSNSESKWKNSFYRAKKQRNEKEGEIVNLEVSNYSSVPDSLKLHVFDSLLTRLKDVQDRLVESFEDD